MKTYEEFYETLLLLKENKWTLKLEFNRSSFGGWSRDFYLGVRSYMNDEELKKTYKRIEDNTAHSISLQMNERISSPYKTLYKNEMNPLSAHEVLSVLDSFLSSAILETI